MVKIWKYQVPGHCEGKIRQVLNVKLQYGKPVVWVMLDDSLDQVRALDFYTVGTGWELTDGDEQIIKMSAYVGTIKDEEGYIWHVFCCPTEPVGDGNALPEPVEVEDAWGAATDSPSVELNKKPEAVG